MPLFVVIILSLDLLLLLALGLALYFYHVALNPKRGKGRVFGAEHNKIPHLAERRQAYEASQAWWATIPHEEVWLTASDGLRLRAHLARNPAGGSRWAILCHGYTSRGTAMMDMARPYYDRGCHVLLPDLRGHGESEGRYIGMGWHDRLDLVAWVRQVISWQKEASIVLHGVSMGAATVMMASGEELPPNVTAVIEDCGYTNAWDMFSYQLKGIFGLPPFPMMPIANWVCRMKAGYSLKEADAEKQLKRARVPVLFIHGTEDSFVPFSMMAPLFEACSSPKDKLVVPGAGHSDAARVAGQAYWDKVFSFIDRSSV